MSRYFMIQSWVGSHENEPDYNGQQCGERNVRSIEAVPLYDQFGNANVSAFSDEAIAARSATKKVSKVPLVNKILPQKVRVDNLTQQMRDLVAEFKQGIHTQSEYDMYIDILAFKRNKAETLLKKALAQKPVRDEDDYDHYEESTQESYEIPVSTTSGVSHKGSDTERKNSWVKLRINVPLDLIKFLTGSVSVLVLLKMLF